MVKFIDNGSRAQPLKIAEPNQEPESTTPRCIDYKLGGETDSAIRWRKKNGVMSAIVTEEAGWITFLKPLLKMPSIFCEFGCYNRKLCVNNPISFFSYNTGPNVNKKITQKQWK